MQYFINLDKDNCYNVDRIFCMTIIMETDTFFISYKLLHFQFTFSM